MKRNVLRMLAPIVALCLLIGILPITAVSAATTAVYDFNGTDFATGMLTTNLSGSSLVSDMSAVPSGYTGSVHAGTHSTYVAVGVDFALPVDTSKITSVKVRMYVPTYTTSGTPQLRIISTGESTSEPGWIGGAFVGTWGGAFDRWCDIDITDAVLNTVTKDANGYLDRFVIAYRVYGTNATVYYDSLTIESEGDIFVGSTAEPEEVTVTPTAVSSENDAATGFYFTVATADPLPYNSNWTVRPVFTEGGVYKLDGTHLNSTRTLVKLTSKEYYVALADNSYTAVDGDIVIIDGVVETDAAKVRFTRTAFQYVAASDWWINVEDPTVEDEEFTVPADGVFDFDGKDFDVPTDTNSMVTSTSHLSSAVADTSSVPTGFTDGVYKASHTIYASTWVDFHGTVDLSKVTSIKVRMYIASYTLESGKAPSFRIFGTSNTYVQQNHDGTYDQWFELELLDLLKNNSVTKNSDGSIEKFLLAYRVYGTTAATVYYDSVTITGEDYFTVTDTSSFVDGTPVSLMENISGQSATEARWNSYLTTADNSSLPGTPWTTTFTDVDITINGTAYSVSLWRADDAYGLFLDLWYSTDLPQDTVYAVITIKAGTYNASDSAGGIVIANDFTYYLYNGDLWNAAPPADFAVDVTFEKIGEASKVSGSVWDMYPTPYDPSFTVGTPWASSWANVAYEIDGVAYTATMKRANNSEGMYFPIDSTVLSPAADGVTIVIKAGTYASNTANDPSIRITEDFTFYVIGGSPTTDFDFDDPAFTATVTVSIDTDVYTVSDAETVTINGETYNRGDTFTTVGTHTLVYEKHSREYARKLVVYRTGEVSDDETTDICDLVKMKRYHAGLTELSDSAKLGADMNSSREKEEDDIMLLRKMLLMDSGLLLLCPETGIEALQPSEYVADLETDYDLTAFATAAMKNGTELYHRSPLHVKWISKENVSEYKVSVATQADFSDAFVYTVTVPQVTLMNLLPATTYYWKVAAGDVETETRSFVTADTVRTLTIGGVDNTRDIGGYTGLDGKTLKYGMVYRSATLDTIDDEGLYQMLTVLGIKTDLDVRTPGEGTAGSGSPLGNTVNYFNYNGPYYWNYTSGLLAESYQDALRGEIRAFTDEANYPIVVHCSVGRDRTGTLLFLIEGLCGMSKSDIFFEYELSFLGRIGGSASANVPLMMGVFEEMYDGIQSYAPDGTFAEACEAFMLSVGITQDEIDTIRELMLEAE